MTIQPENFRTLTEWFHFLGEVEIPVLRKFEWAVRLHNTHFEEIRTAALLHDITAILLHCFVPDKMLEIDTLQQQDKTMRSATAQKSVLGFTIHDLQTALVEAWALPGLLIMLMDGVHTAHPRVCNVVLAVNLARHCARG